MALTPEDVVNKRFQATKFREGYDQDEVDDFLDDVVVELRRLIQENEELQKRLASAESASVGPTGSVGTDPSTSSTEIDLSDLEVDDLGAGELDAGEETPDAEVEESSGSGQPTSDQEAASTEASDVDQALEPAQSSESDQSPESEETTVDSSLIPQPLEESTAEAPGGSSDSTSGLLQLARRLHDEHVREGVQKRDALIADGEAARAQAIADGESARELVLLDAEQAKALVVADAQAVRDQVVAEGHLEAERILAELTDRQRVLVDALGAERLELEERVESLQEFEREYREQLRNYIEGQLRELDATEGDVGDIGVSADDDSLLPASSDDEQ